jgi:hypothetical protein
LVAFRVLVGACRFGSVLVLESSFVTQLDGFAVLVLTLEYKPQAQQRYGKTMQNALQPQQSSGIASLH